MLLPMLIWRAFMERGVLRWLVLGAAGLTGAAASLGSFATPLALLAIGGGIISSLALLFPARGQARVRVLVPVVVIIAMGVLFYIYTRDNSLYAASYSRINYFLVDPLGGGYSAQERSVSRVILAQVSINSFLGEPLLGMGTGSTYNNPYLGGHSSFFDSLGAYGLLGGGGAFAGLVLTLLIGAARRFFCIRSWETLLALTSIILLLVTGITNPYGHGLSLILVLIMTRPFALAGKPDFGQPTTDMMLPHKRRQSPISDRRVPAS
jgi:hypothetical protein